MEHTHTLMQWRFDLSLLEDSSELIDGGWEVTKFIFPQSLYQSKAQDLVPW